MTIFTVTVLHTIHGRKRTWGYFFEHKDATLAVLTNETDMFEDGYYDVAVIEEVPEGLLPMVEDANWYRWEKPGRVVAIAVPEQYRHICSFSMG